MKKAIIILVFCMITSAGFAQLIKKSSGKYTAITEKYAEGTVPTVGGKVVFETVVEAPELTREQVRDLTLRWIQSRFVHPAVLSAKIDAGEGMSPIQVAGEEYLVFTDNFLNLDRTRINYYAEFTCEDGKCTMRIARIRYWYEEERDGGIRFTAEQRITDEQAIRKNKYKFYKEYGKFRIKTIDLKDRLGNELSEALKVAPCQ